VLDFGCGWGRLTRFLARDVAPGHLYGCDPVAGVLDVCRECRVPATLARSDFVPERLPFDGPFELAFAFSVFTHLSERAQRACLGALHAGLAPGGLLVVTVRPPGYLEFCAALHPLRDAAGGAGYLFAPHPAEPSHPQYGGEAMDYGETVVTLAYVREHWEPRFELLHADLSVADPFQIVLTLRRR
jgi:SAM-dependent methyltransferase